MLRVRAKRLHRDGRKRNTPTRTRGLRFREGRQLAGALNKRAPDPHKSQVKVDIGPTQPEGLAWPQSAVEQKNPQCMPPVILGRHDKPPSFFRRQRASFLSALARKLSVSSWID